MSDGSDGARTGQEIGRTLTLARRERGLSLKEVEEATKIRATYLAELEQENFDVLPAVYVQGSLKTYANFLQLDGEALVRELKRRRAAVEAQPAEAQLAETQPVEAGAPSLPSSAGFRASVASAYRRAVAPDGAARAGNPGSLEVRERSAPETPPAGAYGYLALALAAVVVLALLVAALFAALPGEESAVPQVREPLVMRAPEASLVAPDEPAVPGESSASGERGNGLPRSPATRGARDESPPPPALRALAAGQAPAQGSAPARHPAREAPPGTRAAPTPVAQPPSLAPPASAPQSGIPALSTPASSAPAPVIGSSGEPGGFQVRVEVGGDDPVQITGDPIGP